MKKVLLFLASGFESYEASVFMDVIGWNLTDGDQSAELFTCGIEKTVKTIFNFTVQTDFTVGEIHAGDYDALAIPGGYEEYGFYADAYQEKFLELIRQFHTKGKIIASICVGALPVGKSGVLRGKEATTYNMNNGKRQNQLREFGVQVINEPIVQTGNIITCWNPSTAMPVALKLLELLTTKENSDYIKSIMGFK